MRTSNIAKGSIFNIKIDFEKSNGSYIFDKNTKKSFLDFFGMYASLPLGYNHPFLTSDHFKEEIIRCSHIKVDEGFTPTFTIALREHWLLKPQLRQVFIIRDIIFQISFRLKIVFMELIVTADLSQIDFSLQKRD